MPMPCSDHAVLLKATAQHDRRETAVLWYWEELHGRSMAWQVWIRRPHCVNQTGNTQSKPLAVRHGRGMLCVHRPWSDQDLCSTADIVRVNIPRRMKWVKYLACMWKDRYACRQTYNRDALCIWSQELEYRMIRVEKKREEFLRPHPQHSKRHFSTANVQYLIYEQDSYSTHGTYTHINISVSIKINGTNNSELSQYRHTVRINY